jgi:glutamyl-tRNA synthetase
MAPIARFRFAPSPTGYLHVGGARTALFNWIAARQRGGEYLLRIEDTDSERNREEWVDGLQDSLRWLGLEWDGDIVRQSGRLDRYREVTDSLLASGAAYWCDCTADAVQSRHAARGGKPGYDGFCRDRGLGPGEGRAARYRTPDDGSITFDDLVQGSVTFANEDLEDFVVLRSNGIPTFLLANALDDLDQGITHVVRGNEHVNGTPKYLHVRRSAGGEANPIFAHLPKLVNEKRQKLSKRRDDVAVEEYRARGYLPDAMANYLALLGWGPPDGIEIRPIGEIVERFRLEDVTKSDAFFDVKKLDHFNGTYIRALDTERFVELVEPWLPDGADRAGFVRLAPLVQERVVRLDEAPAMVDFLFVDEPVIDDVAWQKATTDADVARSLLDGAVAAYADVDWAAERLHDVTLQLGERHGLKLGKAQAPIRVAVTGRSVGPPLFESLVELGRERTLARLRAALDRFS